MTGKTHSHLYSHSKGRPLVMLVVVLSVWVGSRLMLWESPLLMTEAVAENAANLLASQSTDVGPDAAQSPKANVPNDPAALATAPISKADRAEAMDAPSSSMASMVWEQPVADVYTKELQTGASHQLVWMSAMSHLPVPDAIQARLAQQSSTPVATPREAGSSDRWSLDAWAFWRDGGSGSLVSQGRAPTYGASQAGAVLSYRLAPANGRDPRAYARAYRALIDNGEREIAAGFSARPLVDVPIRAHAELRLTEFANSTEIRPAAFVTTELPQLALPLGVIGEAYAQAGYVAGEAETLFADAQLHLMRDVIGFDLGRFSVGGAAWGGAQDGAERVDLGPSMRLDLRVGDTPARLSVDYRERVAGDAEPPSGVAVTLSTRF